MRNLSKFAALFIAVSAAAVFAFVPPLVSFQGRINDSGGGALTDTVAITFTIYNNPSGSGIAEWTETHPAVPVINGLFTVMLGSFTPLEEDVFDVNAALDRYLAISVSGGPILQPLQKIATVPYALRVATVDDASGGVIDGKLAIGKTNTNAGNFAFVAGDGNSAAGAASSVTGGVQNVASGTGSHVGGGLSNVASGTTATIGGGEDNSADTTNATVGGGENNTASESHAVVAGGSSNTASGDRGAVLGGNGNLSSGAFSTVGAGFGNEASGDRSVVVGGEKNSARGTMTFVGGGGGSFPASDSNSALGDYSTIVGGKGQLAAGEGAFVGGGGYNRARGAFSFIGGGGGASAADSNSSLGESSTIAGGTRNTAGGEGSVVTGGGHNSALGGYSFVGGGGGPNLIYANSATGGISAVVGGERNSATGVGAFVGAGQTNLASSFRSAVVAGNDNSASGSDAFVGAGRSAKARGALSFVGGGGNSAGFELDSNVALGVASVVVGGQDNIAAGRMATIPGGFSNRAQGAFSFAAGKQAQALHGGTFVWGDSTNSNFVSTASNQFLVRASGGMGVGTNAPEANLHVFKASAGTVTSISGTIATLENNATAYLSILAPNASATGVLFGNPFDNVDGGIIYNGTQSLRGLNFRTHGGAIRMVIDSLGNVGLGDNTPEERLKVAGNILATGNVCASNIACPSDARLKTNVETLEDALAMIGQLRGVRYEWERNLPDGREFGSGEQIGLIAQEVQQVVPQAVINGSDGYYAVDYARLVPLLIQGMKEQQLQLDEQRQQIAKLMKLMEQAVQ